MAPDTAPNGDQDRVTDSAAVRCIHCGKEGTHRVCDECFKAPTTAATEDDFDYCDGSVACLARLHLDFCRSLMGWSELAAQEDVEADCG